MFDAQTRVILENTYTETAFLGQNLTCILERMMSQEPVQEHPLTPWLSWSPWGHRAFISRV